MTERAKDTIAIIGAGAIGRGFLPWKIDLDAYRLLFIDADDGLVETLNKRGCYRTFMVKDNRLIEKRVEVDGAFRLSDVAVASYDPAMVFMAVGPKNVRSAARCLQDLRCPVVLCENDPKTVLTIRRHLDYEKVYFAVPDVITSSTAPNESLILDPLAVHSEDGSLFIDERAGHIEGDITFLSEEELLDIQWIAKLFLHNTPHCIAAYLGSMRGYRYIHDVMKYTELKHIVVGAMDEMLEVQKLKVPERHAFWQWYAEKEISRFANELLYDPVSRVAREPYRKLEFDGRLIGAVQRCISVGKPFDNLMAGIVCAALCAHHNHTDLSSVTLDRTSARADILSVLTTIGLADTDIYGAILAKLDDALCKVLEVVM
jgi:hypothetical protein